MALGALPVVLVDTHTTVVAAQLTHVHLTKFSHKAIEAHAHVGVGPAVAMAIAVAGGGSLAGGLVAIRASPPIGASAHAGHTLALALRNRAVGDASSLVARWTDITGSADTSAICANAMIRAITRAG